MNVEATAYGAATIVNALATGKGAAFGIDLWTKARVELTEDGVVETKIIGDPEENTLLAEKCVRAVLERFRKKGLGARVETETNIPIARGLKSSSVAGNAIVLALLTALRERLEPEEILNLVADASLQSKVSVTGAFDDAAASLYGNVVVTDNILRKTIRTFPVEEREVLLLVPREKAYTSEVDLKRIKAFSRQVGIAYDQAVVGRYWDAMTLNGLVYTHALGLPADAIVEAMEAGALAAGISGKGPAYAFVVDRQSKQPVLDILRGHDGDVITSRTRTYASMPLTRRKIGRRKHD